jgi:anti-sigma factor RsiW
VWSDSCTRVAPGGGVSGGATSRRLASTVCAAAAMCDAEEKIGTALPGSWLVIWLTFHVPARGNTCDRPRQHGCPCSHIHHTNSHVLSMCYCRVCFYQCLTAAAAAMCACLRRLPAGAVAKVLQAAQAAETLPLDQGLELERLVHQCTRQLCQAHAISQLYLS